jgi:hypothetical protein
MRENEGWLKRAALLNISAGGCLIRSDEISLSCRRLRMLFEDVPEAGWIDAEVIRSVETNELGVRFISPFRPEFVQATTSERDPRRDQQSAIETPYLGAAIPIW